MKKGFSFIELMVVLSIISLLSTVSIYGIQQLIQQRRLSDAIASLSSTLISAQSNSRSSGFTTVICPSQNGIGCDTDSNWSNGWITYKDFNDNHRLDNGEAVIAVRQNSPGSVSYRFKAPGIPQKIIFYRNGRLWPNGSFTICHETIAQGRTLIMIQSGRIRSAPSNQTTC